MQADPPTENVIANAHKSFRAIFTSVLDAVTLTDSYDGSESLGNGRVFPDCARLGLDLFPQIGIGLA